jgi:thymidylate synthase (FAD)
MQDMDQNIIKVLDHGYVRLINTMGSDTDVVNAARVSFDKQVDYLSEKDLSLINFLVKNRHDSCLRHCAMTFEIYAPLMVARQAYKHNVASTMLDDQLGWNESSRRYVTENEEFYIPGIQDWRSAPDNKKQGSGDSLGMYMGAKYHQTMTRTVTEAHRHYLEALEDGVAPEQARLLLPAYAMYVRWRWTVSLNGVMNFLNLRLDPHAQWEIQQYAKAVEEYVKEFYPVTYEAWVKHRSI